MVYIHLHSRGGLFGTCGGINRIYIERWTRKRETENNIMIKLCSKMPGRKYTLINKQTKTLFYVAEFFWPGLWRAFCPTWHKQEVRLDFTTQGATTRLVFTCLHCPVSRFIFWPSLSRNHDRLVAKDQTRRWGEKWDGGRAERPAEVRLNRYGAGSLASWSNGGSHSKLAQPLKLPSVRLINFGEVGWGVPTAGTEHRAPGSV